MSGNAAKWRKAQAAVDVLRPVKEMTKTKMHDVQANTTSKATAVKQLYVQYNLRELRKVKSGQKETHVQHGWLDSRLAME